MCDSSHSRTAITLWHTDLERRAVEAARAFRAADPFEILARRGVTLCTSAHVARGWRKVILAAWDPVLRRVELFGCGPQRSDDCIVRALGHELWHLEHHELDQRGSGPPREDRRDEQEADRFARAFVAALGPEGVAACGQALRSRAMTRSGSSVTELVSLSPLSIAT